MAQRSHRMARGRGRRLAAAVAGLAMVAAVDVAVLAPAAMAMPTTTISGTATDATSAAKLAGICPTASTSAGTGPGTLAQGQTFVGGPTGADGTYSITVFSYSAYVVQFRDCGANQDDGYSDQYWTGAGGGTPLIGSAKSVVVHGNPVTGVDAVMNKGATTISGTVTASDGTTPLSQVCVTATGAHVELTAPTGSDGTYHIPHVVPGAYTVRFADCDFSGARNLVEQFWNGKVGGSDVAGGAYPMTVSSTPVTGKDAQMKTGGTISGTVFDGSATPLADICVTSVGGPDQSIPSGSFGGMLTFGQPGGSAVTDANGNYEITGLPYSSFKLEFSNCGGGTSSYVDEWWTGGTTGTPSAAAARTITLTASSHDATGKDAVLAPGATIGGTITGGANAFVEATADGLNWHSGGANGSGVYTIRNLAPGTYKLGFQPAGFGDARYYDGTAYATSVAGGARGVRVYSGGTTSGIDGTLYIDRIVSGTVTDKTTAALLSNICVYADRAATDGNPFERYFGNVVGGHYSMLLPTGSYTVAFSNCGNPTKYRDQWYKDADSSSGKLVVDVTAGASVGGIDAHLHT